MNHRCVINAFSLMVVSLWCSLSLSFAKETSQPTYKVTEELDVKVTMRDGIRLSTNIYRPESDGKFPALLMRTPYGNGGAGNRQGHFFAERGYVFVVQDTRGRFESEGIFYPIIFEAEDGLDTHRWLTEQPWCDGSIGTHGGSYVGMTQWMPALQGSPNVKAMFPVVAYSENYTVHYQNGANQLRLFTHWYTMITAPFDFDMEEYQRDTINRVNRHLPLFDQDTQVGWRLPFMRDTIQHPENDRYWEQMKYDGKYQNNKAAVFITAGWYDLFTSQNLKNFTEMTKPSIAPDIHARQKLMVGPWGHGIPGNGTLGVLDFGKESVIDLQEIMLRWFDCHVKGIDNSIMEEPPVKIFVMGDNVWRYENEWPLERTKYTQFYFHSKGRANTKDGDGTLSTARQKDEPVDSYIYNPDDPVPSMPDSSTFNAFIYFPIDHSVLEGREDILVYSTPLLTKDIEVTGPVEVILYAASTASNTDFTGKLLDVYPDGRAVYICDGIIRASFRNGSTNTSNIEPGKVYEYHIDLWATSNVFKKGHRIRVEISSSNFPRFDRNLNIGRTIATETERMKAEQTIYHNQRYPTCVVLPVIE